MTDLEIDEREILQAYDSGKLKPIASKAELQRMRAAAQATAASKKYQSKRPSEHASQAQKAIRKVAKIQAP